MDSRGFTLIESFVAIMMFSFAIVALMLVVSKGVSGTREEVKKNVALYLAQQGMEAVQYVRDNNFLNDALITTNISHCAVGSGGCYLNYSDSGDAGNLELRNCALDACPYVVKGIGGFYNELNESSGVYRRQILVNQYNNAGVMDVTVKVTWNSGDLIKEVSLNKIFTGWYTYQQGGNLLGGQNN